MRDGLELLLKSYDYLRQEILNSINWQNRFVIAEAIIISALLGLGLTEQPLRFLIIAIPPAVTALTAFWLVEQSRMMRAGDYLQLLEDEINLKVGGAYILWENWLRTGKAGGIHKIYHVSQHFGVFFVFYIVAGISLWKLWEDPDLYQFPRWAWGLYVAMLVFLLVLVFLVIPHRPREKSDFEEWEKKYWKERLGKDLAPNELEGLKKDLQEIEKKSDEILKRTSQKQEGRQK